MRPPRTACTALRALHAVSATASALMTEPLLLRPSTVDDIAAMTHIYADAVRSGTGSFELSPLRISRP